MPRTNTSTTKWIVGRRSCSFSFRLIFWHFCCWFQVLHQRVYPRWGPGCLLAWSWFWSLLRPLRGSWKALNLTIYGGSTAAPKIPGDVWRSLLKLWKKLTYCVMYISILYMLPSQKCFTYRFWQGRLRCTKILLVLFGIGQQHNFLGGAGWVWVLRKTKWCKFCVARPQIHKMNNEETTWGVRVYTGLYCSDIWGIM